MEMVYDVETKAQSSDWGDKDGIEGGAEIEHKKWFFEVLRELEKKTLAQVYDICWGLLWRGQNRYSWINK